MSITKESTIAAAIVLNLAACGGSNGPSAPQMPLNGEVHVNCADIIKSTYLEPHAEVDAYTCATSDPRRRLATAVRVYPRRADGTIDYVSPSDFLYIYDDTRGPLHIVTSDRCDEIITTKGRKVSQVTEKCPLPSPKVSKQIDSSITLFASYNETQQWKKKNHSFTTNKHGSRRHNTNFVQQRTSFR